MRWPTVIWSVRDGAFELVLIETLGAFNALSILKKAHRFDRSRGVRGCVPEPGSGSTTAALRGTLRRRTRYYDFVLTPWGGVRARAHGWGQTPFVGYAIADISRPWRAGACPRYELRAGGGKSRICSSRWRPATSAARRVRVIQRQEAVLGQRGARGFARGGRKDRARTLGAARQNSARERARLKTGFGELEGDCQGTADYARGHARTELEQLRCEAGPARVPNGNGAAAP